jgi:peptidoglycan/xylan/chitin deacetylase (PgdA/CDA1 family)
MKLNRTRPLRFVAAATLLGTVLVGASIASAESARADTGYRPLNNDCSAGYVELTFDDGPDINTPLVLTTLEGLNLKATFFVLGSKLANNPTGQATVADEVAHSFSVQNHTWDHASFTGATTGTAPLTQTQIQDELDSASNAIVAAGAPKPTLYRPPYGDINAWADNVAQHDGYRIVMPWGTPSGNIVDSGDWTGISTAQIVSNVTNGYTKNGYFYPGIKDGSIVLMHDGESQTTLNTVNALQPIVDYMNTNHLCSTATIRDDATGGVVPPPAPPEPSTGNLVQNASLENLKGGGPAAEPVCFQQAGANVASNVATWSLTSDGHSGNVAERVDVTNWAAGDRKLVITQRTSESSCLATVTAGTSYSTWVWYKGSWAYSGPAPAKVSIVTYYRSASGVWTYWQASPLVAPSSSWTLANFVTAPLPAGATALSFGLAIAGNGTLITDDYALAPH